MSDADTLAAPAPVAFPDAVPALARRQKRASLLTLSLMGVAPLAILMWDPLYRDVRVFPSVALCDSDSPLSAEQCQKLYNEALRRNAQIAPSFVNFTACEGDFLRISPSCKDGTWCEPQAVQNCALGDDGLARPNPAAFLVSESLLERLRQGEQPALAELDMEELQPVYGMSEENLGGVSSGYTSTYHYPSYYGGFSNRNWYMFTSQGQYLGDQSIRQLNLHTSHLQAGAGYAQHFQANALPARMGGTARGGFGASARSSMALATG
ncbi:DUF1190 domain-containing protein [Aquipseudomonas campi]|uniref:DUF1190 domain-containing protein n=1 Tax=Aquipseudomonas campi TaxID=2731681 RepID=A0A6M8FLQ7_9GAMM|nr:DUF1190 domain-containing protein [Pseudomonas campi]QKE65567.1 DUF1190 domain-containing protein [Pseudomonas campi]